MISRHRGSLNIWCALIGIAATCCLADGIADHDHVAAGLSATVPEVPNLSQAGASAPVKALPVKPPDPPGVTTDGTLPDKLATRVAAVAADTPWTVNLVASSPSLWVGRYTMLTATTNKDVGPTPYFIRIWDDDSGSYVASCGTGTACSIYVTRAGVRTTSFKAVVASSGAPVASAFAGVDWHGSGVRLTESETTVPAGSAVTLTTFTDYDIGASPWYVQIYDDTTRTLLQSCGVGTICAVTVRQAAATTHLYRACFSGYGTSYPPPNLMECTMQKLVTWTGNQAIRVFLQSTSPNTVTATASIDVTTTPYYIQIYNFDGDRIAVCGSGTSCTAVSNPTSNHDNLIGLVGPSSSTIGGILGLIPATSRVFSRNPIDGQGGSVSPSPGPRPGDPLFRAAPR